MTYQQNLVPRIYGGDCSYDRVVEKTVRIITRHHKTYLSIQMIRLNSMGHNQAASVIQLNSKELG